MLLTHKITAVVASVVVTAGGALGVTSMDKSVTLTVDGTTSTVHGFASNVREVLTSNGIALGERDLVIPSLETAVEDGSSINVMLSRKVVALIDGQREEFYTTANSLDAALAQWEAHDLTSARLSVSRSTQIGREGLEFVATTQKPVTLVVAGKKRAIDTTASTVGELLTEQNLTLGDKDKISPALELPVTPDMTVKLTRISVTVKSGKVTVPFTTIKKKTSDLYVGQTKVKTPGKTGSAKVTWQITKTNGKVTKKVQKSRTVLVAPTAQVVLVGTKARSTTSSSSSSGAGINLARAAMWDRIARCESGGNWSINTGNGYYGGLQFSKASWNAMRGTDFAAYPHQASRAEQITVANRYYAIAGLSPWGCRHAA